MDPYIEAARSTLRLTKGALEARLKHIDKQPIGMSHNYNERAHTTALLGIVEAALEVAKTEDDGWWVDPRKAPF